jgi:hypothetical protein
MDAIKLYEPCGLDCLSDDGEDVAEGIMSDEEESNMKSAAKASLPQDMTDTDDEATVAFDTSDTEDDEDPLPPQKACDNAMTEEDKNPPAKASLPQKNANDQGKQGAALTNGKSKSLPKSGKKVYACNKKTVVSKKKSAPSKKSAKTVVSKNIWTAAKSRQNQGPSKKSAKTVVSKKKSAPTKPRVKSSVSHQDNQRPRLRSARGSTSGRSNLPPHFAPSSSSTHPISGSDDNKENDAPEQVHVKQNSDGRNATSNQHNRQSKSLQERVQAIEAGLGISPISHSIPRLSTYDRVQHLEREVSGKVASQGTTLIERTRMLEHEVLGYD